MLVLNHHRGHTHPSSLALHGCVEVVLDGIVRAARHVFGHLGPSGSHLVIQLHDLSFLFRGKGCLVDWNRRTWSDTDRPVDRRAVLLQKECLIGTY